MTKTIIEFQVRYGLTLTKIQGFQASKDFIQEIRANFSNKGNICVPREKSGNMVFKEMGQNQKTWKFFGEMQFRLRNMKTVLEIFSKYERQ